MHRRADDADEVCENTWTLSFVAPYFSLLADRELRINDSTTRYNINRPDIQITIGPAGHMVASVEIKRFWAGRVEKQQDQGRVISAVAHCLAKDALTHRFGATPPARIAMWIPGDEVFVYEVMSLAACAYDHHQQRRVFERRRANQPAARKVG
ncbi:hypothetical protein HDU88_003882 [Geranomyces variabilis]|nr:hypothetical protein HDU88_003882 [Geranomyces variabilis]